MTKAALRTIYKDKRKELSDTDRMKLDDLVLIQFQRLQLPHVQTLLSYWPIPTHHEVNTLPLTDFMQFRVPGLTLAYPRTIHEDISMEAIIVHDDTEYITTPYGITEPQGGELLPPEELDMVFVPMLAYDERGYRVGYGKGFYDRFLKLCKDGVIKIGFSYFAPEPLISDVNDFDIPLNFAITPERIYEF
ncbi:MAG TPA: 5-formyltetrahydrofolate cyclo-ligase [Chitinophagaceae bacterium]|nr:5-formyltetrahydrofolate cyclo-ligase [Chitinophagaceae bacterium]